MAVNILLGAFSVPMFSLSSSIWLVRRCIKFKLRETSKTITLLRCSRLSKLQNSRSFVLLMLSIGLLSSSTLGSGWAVSVNSICRSLLLDRCFIGSLSRLLVVNWVKRVVTLCCRW